MPSSLTWSLDFVLKALHQIVNALHAMQWFDIALCIKTELDGLGVYHKPVHLVSID